MSWRFIGSSFCIWTSVVLISNILGLLKAYLLLGMYVFQMIPLHVTFFLNNATRCKQAKASFESSKHPASIKRFKFLAYLTWNFSAPGEILNHVIFQLTNRMWLSAVCTLIKNKYASSRWSKCCGLTRPQPSEHTTNFDNRDEGYSLSIR